MSVNKQHSNAVHHTFSFLPTENIFLLLQILDFSIKPQYENHLKQSKINVTLVTDGFCNFSVLGRIVERAKRR
jgi:hypothetical protein